MNAASNTPSIRKRGRKRVRRLKRDGLRLRLALHILPERFRSMSAALWLDQMNRETEQIRASTREITELTEELRGF